MRYHTLSGLDYFNVIRSVVTSFEGIEKGVYFDTATPPIATIGVGYNLEVGDVFNKLIDAFEFKDPNLISNGILTNQEEDDYIKDINDAIAANRTQSSLQTALNDIMAARAGVAAGRDPSIQLRTTFTFDDDNHALQVFDDPAFRQTYEDLIRNFVADTAWDNLVPAAGVPQQTYSWEQTTLFSLAYNGLLGKKSKGDWKSPKPHQALEEDDRAEAWFEIRYNSNGGSHKDAVADRRFAESTMFGL